MKFFKFVIPLVFVLFIASCTSDSEEYLTEMLDPELLHISEDNLTNVHIHNIFPPPVVSRNAAYPSIAAYEVARHMDSSYVSLAGQIKHLNPVPEPEADKTYSYPLAAFVAFNETARNFVFTAEGIDTFYQRVLGELGKKGIPKDVFERSVAYGKEVGAFITEWSLGDNYAYTRSMPKYTVLDVEGRWRPTPPAYIDGVEPHWGMMRTFTMDSVSQFKIDAHHPYSKDTTSEFYKEAKEVYLAVKEATTEEKHIAQFWDCNPYEVSAIGHVVTATKKITPGGHWMSITKIASRKSNADFVKTAYAYAMASIALYDGFVVCWYEKFRWNRLRPESAINELIDENWTPILQTPPFPDYLSGHSVISGAVYPVLTHIFGENFAYEDDTELRFGIPIRKFNSFQHAAEEASISRLYGGIHFKVSTKLGKEVGKKIGHQMLERINLIKA